MRSGLFAACLAAAALAGGCGDDDGSKRSSDGSSGGSAFGGQGDCQEPDAALTKAARDHVAPLKVGSGGGEGNVDSIEVEVCRTTDDNATATVTVLGLRDDSTRDVRHDIRLIRSGGLWQVVDDQDSRRCQKGRGQQEFAEQLPVTLGDRAAVACLAVAVLASGCGEAERASTQTTARAATCLQADPTIEAAARAHVRDVSVGKEERFDADRIDVDVCRTSDMQASATITIHGLRDDAVRDVRHALTLVPERGFWLVRTDVETRRCQKGRGQQEFAADLCV